MSTTQKALDWIDAAPPGQERTVYQAHKKFDLSLPALSRAAKERAARVRCPHCGTLLPKGKRLVKP